MNNFTLNPINLNNQHQRLEVDGFLSQVGLILDDDVEYTVVARSGGQIIGTCSKSGRVIKCLAVSAEHRGEGLSGELVKSIMDRLFEEGCYHYFVFTQSHNTCLFKSLNFKMLHKGREAALLEGGIITIEQRLKKLKNKFGVGDSKDRIALVMNCNPFTKGHLHLVEQAAASGREVLIFIVEENKSVFSFDDRIEMVRQGTNHLSNVTVLPGTEYIISSATFPSYFLRQADNRTAAYMELDADLFATYFSPYFGISTRYVGDEPYCDVTLSYNNTLKRVLGEAGLKVVEIPRLPQADVAISASQVRKYIRHGKDNAIKCLVPESTLKYIFETSGGRAAVERIKNSDTPH